MNFLARIFARPLRLAAFVGAGAFTLIFAGLALELHFSSPYLICLAHAFEKHNDAEVEDLELAKRIAPMCAMEFSEWRASDPLFRSEIDEVALALDVVWRHRGHRIAKHAI
jgi:hypothetical protein